MKKKYIKIIFTIIGLLTPYIIFTFVSLEPNVTNWHIEYRAFMVILTLFAIMGVFFIWDYMDSE